MTIFGFNTDAKVGDTVYHVQSEARENDLLLQTQVFVKGHCIGKRASSYAETFVQPGYTVENMHELLKQQHRMMLEAVRESRANDVFCTDGEVQDVNAGGMSLRWKNADAVFNASPAVVKLQVLVHHQPYDGALVTARLDFTHDAPIHSQSMSEADGMAEIEVELPPVAGTELPVLIRAKGDDKSVTRKFRLKRA
ncbi:MAG: hypothetical protein HYX26_00240 [Acidobacteriales bacterium]|nr:hypothetical protein [Terriglobales bacterium]